MHNDENFTTCMQVHSFPSSESITVFHSLKKFQHLTQAPPARKRVKDSERHVGVASPSYKPTIKLPETKVFTYKQSFTDNYTELPFPI
jgi:hypothetical protein